MNKLHIQYVNFLILLFLTYFARGIVMMTFSPILMRIGYGLSWQSAVVAAWGGLRGAVGLALALQVYIDHPLIGGKVRHAISMPLISWVWFLRVFFCKPNNIGTYHCQH